MTDANEHSKEQRLNARIEYLERRAELLLDSFVFLARKVAGPKDADATEDAIRRLFAPLQTNYAGNIADIAEASRLLREVEKDD